MSKKILLPDDAVVKDIMQNSFLHRDGFEFVPAKGSDEIFLQIEEIKPELVILDIETVGIDAAGLCTIIKSNSSLEETSILLIVPSESRKTADEYSCIDADAIVGRPIDHQRFITSASHLLGVFDRAAPRLETFIMVSCGSDIDELHQGWIRNINMGGAFIETRDLLPVDYRLQVQFEIEEGAELITCTARVAWVNHPDWIKCEKLPSGMGVQFIDLEEEDQKIISDFIDSQMDES